MPLMKGAPYKGKPSESIWLSDAIIELTAEMLGLRMKKGSIKRELAKLNVTAENPDGEPPSQGVFERLLREARELIRERLAINQQDLVADSVELYYQIIADPNASIQNKLQAQSQLEHLLGIGARFKQSDAPTSLADKAKVIREAMRRLEEAEDKEALLDDSNGQEPQPVRSLETS